MCDILKDKTNVEEITSNDNQIKKINFSVYTYKTFFFLLVEYHVAETMWLGMFFGDNIVFWAFTIRNSLHFEKLFGETKYFCGLRGWKKKSLDNGFRNYLLKTVCIIIVYYRVYFHLFNILLMQFNHIYIFFIQYQKLVALFYYYYYYYSYINTLKNIWCYMSASQLGKKLNWYNWNALII